MQIFLMFEQYVYGIFLTEMSVEVFQ